MLSILIPLRNEYENLDKIESQYQYNLRDIDYELILIDDYSTDDTLVRAKEIAVKNKNVVVLRNSKKGLGGAISLGIQEAKGDFICITMADFSDDIEDLKKYLKIINEKKVDAVFGSRFIKGSKVINYPKKKLILNRIFNFIVKILFLNSYNDYTNAFKIYRATTLKNFLPLVSESFNVFLEIPLKVISRGHKYELTPINWSGRQNGKTKFRIKELKSKYLFTLFYCFLEKNLLNYKNK